MQKKMGKKKQNSRSSMPSNGSNVGTNQIEQAMYKILIRRQFPPCMECCGEPIITWQMCPQTDPIRMVPTDIQTNT